MNKQTTLSAPYFAFLLKGFVSISIQTLVIRELLIIFSGNELTISIMLASWLILEAIGSGIVSRIKIKNCSLIYILCQIAICVTLPFVILFIRNIKNFLGLMPSQALGLEYVFFISFLSLAPFCILDGFMFPVGSRILLKIKENSKSLSLVYILEAIGVIIGAFIFTYLLIPHLNSLQIVLILGIMNIISSLALIITNTFKNIVKNGLVFIGAILIGIITILHFNGFIGYVQDNSIQKQFKGFKILEYKNSLYSNICVGQRQEQRTYFLNGVPIFTMPDTDIGLVQDLIHFPLLIHENPKRVLLIGTPYGALNEIVKHDIQKVRYLEIDPLMVSMIKFFSYDSSKSQLDHLKVTIDIQDARSYIKNTKEKYDIILINLPPPSNIGLNRFYTSEFFKESRKALKNNGLLSLHMPGTISYYSKELKELNVNILETLKSQFKNTHVIPGETNIFLASGERINLDPEYLISRLNSSNIKASLFNKDYIKYRLDNHYLDWFKESLKDVPVKLNRDTKPLAVFYSVSLWNSKFHRPLKNIYRYLERIKIWLIFSFLIVVLFILFNRSKDKKKFSTGFAICTTGFSQMLLTIMLIILFQSSYGYIYGKLALLNGFFMLGISIGAGSSYLMLERWSRNLKIFIRLEFIMVGICLTVGSMNFLDTPYEFIFFILAISVGLIGGFEFPLANEFHLDKSREKNLGTVYALDLLGSFIGAIICGVILIPLYGIANTILLVASIKLMSIFFLEKKSP